MIGPVKFRLSVISTMFLFFTLLCIFTTSEKQYKAVYNQFGLTSLVLNHSLEISNENAKAYAKTAFGSLVSSRMLYRIKTPLSELHPRMKYSNSKPASPISGIWGGYIANSSNIKGVSGKFNVTKVTNGWDATWVGIGGFNGINLAQAGIDMNLMEAWYELYPTEPVYLFKVNPSDKMFSSISFDNATGYWDFLIQDLTTGVYYSKEFNFNPDQSTAEWAVEDVGNKPIGKFGTVSFSDCSWKDSSFKNQDLNSGAASILYKSTLSGGDRISVPSKIGLDNGSFSMSAN